MSKCRVEVHEQVTTGRTGSGQLCFQWVTYQYKDRSQQNGYRLSWRRPDGSLQPGRSQARIPSAAVLLELLKRATAAGWFVTVEGRSPGGSS
jgi:hypothetical protein